MYFKIRKIGAKPGEDDLIANLSKTAAIQELRNFIFERLNVEVKKQILLYKGKQLVDDHRIVDYDIQLNDVVQLMIKTVVPECDQSTTTPNEVINKTAPSISSESNEEPTEIKCSSKYYKIGDLVDVIDVEYGSWCEATIVEILKKVTSREENVSLEEGDLTFKIKLEIDLDHFPLEVTFSDIRPRARYTYKKSELESGLVVMANYNIEEPTTRGYWYDFKITKVSGKSILGTVLVGKEKTPLEDCSIKFVDEIMRIEKPVLLTDRQHEDESTPPLRKNPYRCNKCKDIQTRKCKECGCHICGEKKNPDTMILCDECDYGYHIACLDPPLAEVPSDPEWYCPSCKTDENEIVKAGDKLKFSSKKAKMASNKEDAAARDWGRGMACVGRTKECTIVPKDHYGPVPGVEVGTCWKFRLQVSEAGIHRPHVAGIHGRETDGAYSLVLSGGYEDDIDKGEEFYYTGSGGRDLSGNKRVSGQSCDQTLTRMNKALALNCNAKFNDKTGAESKDWKAGKPVRVVRNYKLSKHSKYAPKDGNRYDGLYKVVKYYPEKGKSGFLVWRYLLRRDDPAPPPWAKNGQELEMLYPPGYLEAQAQAEKDKQEGKKKGSKRSIDDSTDTPESKKTKINQFELDPKLDDNINQDTANEKLWLDCKSVIPEGKLKFLAKVEELFLCVCCQEVVYLPVSTPCKHNICKSCLQRSFGSDIFSCPYCRYELGKDYKLVVNQNLSKILLQLYPGYENGR